MQDDIEKALYKKTRAVIWVSNNPVKYGNKVYKHLKVIQFMHLTRTWEYWWSSVLPMLTRITRWCSERSGST